MLDCLPKHINLIYQTVELPQLWKEVLETIVKDCGLNSAMFFLEAKDQAEPLALYEAGLSEEAVSDYYSDKLKKSVFMERLYKSKRGCFHNINDFCDEPVWTQTPIYQEWCIPLNIRNVVGCLIDISGKSTLRLHFHSSVSQGIITREQVNYLNLLIPHIQRAIDYHEHFALCMGFQSALGYFLECYPTPALLLDGNKELKYINHAAEDLVYKQSILSVKNQRLQVLVASEQKRLDRMLDRCLSQHRERQASSLAIKNNAGEVVLEFNLMYFGGEEFLFGKHCSRPLVMLRMRNMSDQPWVNEEALGELFGLTNKEMRVAALLAAGESVEAIAEQTHTSVNTVRTHLKSLFRKTDSKSQQQLVIKLLSGIQISK
jgi:DNA-binding CsgD family transcriptional regulator